MGDKNAKTNEKMVKFAPELASEYAKYPLSYRSWMSPDAQGPKNSPCFISAPRGAPMKMDYVHGPGPKGFGYYHVLTRDSYVILYARLTNEMPGCCCDCRPTVRQEVSDWDDVKTICYNRSVATKPDDAQAKKDALAIARGVRFCTSICLHIYMYIYLYIYLHSVLDQTESRIETTAMDGCLL